ncbi:MAG: hypothetical protein J3K34DRAFT_499870 [Monoraphidium minutum]|nr:MAG: hypothetical protein J3K34DRAFT_499870 [Monoraphidium minutum]
MAREDLGAAIPLLLRALGSDGAGTAAAAARLLAGLAGRKRCAEQILRVSGALSALAGAVARGGAAAAGALRAIKRGAESARGVWRDAFCSTGAAALAATLPGAVRDQRVRGNALWVLITVAAVGWNREACASFVAAGGVGALVQDALQALAAAAAAGRSTHVLPTLAAIARASPDLARRVADTEGIRAVAAAGRAGAVAAAFLAPLASPDAAARAAARAFLSAAPLALPQAALDGLELAAGCTAALEREVAELRAVPVNTRAAIVELAAAVRGRGNGGGGSSGE